jgi:hypothetical protein
MNQVAFRGTLIVLTHMIVLFGHETAHSHFANRAKPLAARIYCDRNLCDPGARGAPALDALAKNRNDASWNISRGFVALRSVLSLRC